MSIFVIFLTVLMDRIWAAIIHVLSSIILYTSSPPSCCNSECDLVPLPDLTAPQVLLHPGCNSNQVLLHRLKY